VLSAIHHSGYVQTNMAPDSVPDTMMLMSGAIATVVMALQCPMPTCVTCTSEAVVPAMVAIRFSTVVGGWEASRPTIERRS